MKTKYGQIYTIIQEKMYEHGSSEAWFPSYGFLTGIAGDRLLGPCFFPPRITGVVYCDSLRNVLSDLLQDVDLQSGVHLLSIYHGLEPHFLLALQEFLYKALLEKWMQQGGQQQGQLVPLEAAKLYRLCYRNQ